ncbi:MAG: PQQ-binding-like beta-propeller repeat protein [Verrucomicrobia bacterium]|nr:PQQ-binding-like beta-propeller repeat protein [Verrucomicrobiota bacterium]
METRDRYTGALGLSEFLGSEQIAFSDVTAVLRDGGTPDLATVDLLIVGAFITNEPELRAAYQRMGATFHKFVADGGLIVVLGQADQDQEMETWMEKPRRIRRADPDFPTAYITQKDHLLLKQPEQITTADLRGWRVPATWPSANTVWEAINEWNQGAVILAADESSTPSNAAMIEMGWGAGRAIFLAMTPDKAFVTGNDVARKGGSKLLRNLMAYAPLVRSGAAPPIQITPTRGYKHPVQGVVYQDQNRNGKQDEAEQGLAGIAMSDGFDVVMTDDSGAYRLPNKGNSALFVFVHQPGNVKQSGQSFFHRLPNEAPAGLQFDFGLEPEVVESDPGSGVRFVQLTDSHVRDVSDRDYMQQATTEIYAMKPPPDFVVATGDLVDWGVDEHFQNYVAGMQQPPVPYFNVFGNHEIVFGPIERYHQYIGPDYYSFERAGILFLVLNCVTPSERQDAWRRRILELRGAGRPVVVFQHFPPSLKQLEQFGEMGVKSVFSGHWHSEKEMKHGTVQSINSPTFIMGGIDASPAGFKVVQMAADGSAKTEWRYGFQKKRLTIVSPQKGSPVSSSYFPIIINAYDTSRDVASVRWRLESENKRSTTQTPFSGFGRQPQKHDDVSKQITARSGSLRRDSATSWSAAHPHLPLGSYAFHVEVQDTQGGAWSAIQQVESQMIAPAKPEPRGDWPMFMGDSSRTGISPGRSGSLPLRLAWSVDTGGDPDFASPILADGRLYITLKKRTGGRTNGVASFHPVTGDRLWLFETPMAINHTPAYAKGILCVAEMGGRIYGLDAVSGEKRWHHDLIDDKARYSYCAPVAHDGWFYAGVMRRLARLRVSDGQLSWEKQIGGADNDWISSYGSPAANGTYVVMSGLLSSGGGVVVSRANDGSKIWSHPADGGMLASPAIAGDRVLFCTMKSILYCQRLSDGTPLWSQNLGVAGKGANWSATTPAVKVFAQGGGFVVAGSGDGRMYGLDLADGRILWTHVSAPTLFKVSPYRRDDRPLLSSPTIAGNEVFFGSADGHVYCLDLTTGETLWAFEIGASVMSTPMVTGNVIYVAASDGRLYAFTSGNSGKPL